MRRFVLIFICFFSIFGWAAKSPESSITRHWVGGQWTPPLSLLDVKSEYSKKTKVSRILFEFGLRSGLPLCCKPGFYHVEVSPKQQRAVITLRKTAYSQYGLPYLKKKISESRHVRTTEMTVDPVDKDLVVTLYLKKGTRVLTREISSKQRHTFLAVYLKGQ